MSSFEKSSCYQNPFVSSLQKLTIIRIPSSVNMHQHIETCINSFIIQQGCSILRELRGLREDEDIRRLCALKPARSLSVCPALAASEKHQGLRSHKKKSLFFVFEEMLFCTHTVSAQRIGGSKVEERRRRMKSRRGGRRCGGLWH